MDCQQLLKVNKYAEFFRLGSTPLARPPSKLTGFIDASDGRPSGLQDGAALGEGLSPDEVGDVGADGRQDEALPFDESDDLANKMSRLLRRSEGLTLKSQN